MLLNTQWYNANATRNYPLDDGATTVDDAGVPLPADILLDAKLRFPATLGRYLYVGSVTVTRRLVSVVLMASEAAAEGPPESSSAGDATGDTPIATISLRTPVAVGVPHAVEPLVAGVGGWIVFGAGANDEPYSGRFSSVHQGMLLTRCARSDRVPPVASFGKVHTAGALTGLVHLKAGFDLAITTADRLIHGQIVRAVVFSLANTLDRNVLKLYAGANMPRPESGTCKKPALERIGPAFPDCDGNIEIDFRNMRYTAFAGGGGMVIDLNLGLDQACAAGTPPYMPDDSGSLPDEYTHLCDWPWYQVSLSSSMYCGDEPPLAQPAYDHEPWPGDVLSSLHDTTFLDVSPLAAPGDASLSISFGSLSESSSESLTCMPVGGTVKFQRIREGEGPGVRWTQAPPGHPDCLPCKEPDSSASSDWADIYGQGSSVWTCPPFVDPLTGEIIRDPWETYEPSEGSDSAVIPPEEPSVSSEWLSSSSSSVTIPPDPEESSGAPPEDPWPFPEDDGPPPANLFRVIRVRVTGCTLGAPVAGALVRFVSPNGAVATKRTDADGYVYSPPIQVRPRPMEFGGPPGGFPGVITIYADKQPCWSLSNVTTVPGSSFSNGFGNPPIPPEDVYIDRALTVPHVDTCWLSGPACTEIPIPTSVTLTIEPKTSETDPLWYPAANGTHTLVRDPSIAGFAYSKCIALPPAAPGGLPRSVLIYVTIYGGCEYWTSGSSATPSPAYGYVVIYSTSGTCPSIGGGDFYWGTRMTVDGWAGACPTTLKADSPPGEIYPGAKFVGHLRP